MPPRLEMTLPPLRLRLEARPRQTKGTRVPLCDIMQCRHISHWMDNEGVKTPFAMALSTPKRAPPRGSRWLSGAGAMRESASGRGPCPVGGQRGQAGARACAAWQATAGFRWRGRWIAHTRPPPAFPAAPRWLNSLPQRPGACGESHSGGRGGLPGSPPPPTAPGALLSTMWRC